MISKEKILSAKQADLPNILQNMGIDLIAEGNSYRLCEHESLKLFRRNGIWLYKWWSRGGEVGDGIQYLRRHFGMSFNDAVKILSKSTNVQHRRPDNFDYQPSKKVQAQWTSITWQNKSKKLIRAGRSYLFGPNGKERISYLVNERGLHLDTIRSHGLGWLPAKEHMPSKILIPCYNSQGRLIRIRFRIDNPKPGHERYRISKGSNSYCPFPLGISYGKPVVLVESELDAILVAQEVGRRVGVLGIGTTGFTFTPMMVRYLNEKVPLILISLDNDQGGRDKTISLINELHNAINWCVPEKYGKDPGEAWKRMSIDKWVEAGLKDCLYRIYAHKNTTEFETCKNR